MIGRFPVFKKEQQEALEEQRRNTYYEACIDSRLELGRWELTQTVKQIAQEFNLNQAIFQEEWLPIICIPYLQGADPDLIIRTSENFA